MSIHVLGEKDLRDEASEVLVIELDYGDYGIVDSSRIAIETSIEGLFRGWILPLLQLENEAARETLGRDIGAFREAEKLLIEIAPRSSYVVPSGYYMGTMVGFVLLDVEHASFKKTLRIVVMNVAISIFSQWGGNSIPPYRPYQTPPAQSCVVVPTESCLEQFVSYLGTIQNDIDARPDALATYHSLISLYSELALIPNGKVSYSVLLKGHVTVTFEVTSDQARHDLPLLEQKVAKHQNRR